MSEEEMIQSLLSTINRLNSKIASLENVIEIALEGLHAIEEYGNSQEIASKTVNQIKDLDKK